MFWLNEEKKIKDLKEFVENMTQEEGRDIDTEGAYDKPHNGCDRERISEKLQKLSGDILAWHGGGQNAKNEFL
jgi:hypothetical protein